MTVASSGSSYRPMCGVIPGSRWSPEKRRPLPGSPAGWASSRWRQTWPGVWPGVQIARRRRPGRSSSSPGTISRSGSAGAKPGQVRAGPSAGGAQRRHVLLGGPGRGELRRHVREPALRPVLPGAPHDRGVRRVHRDPRAGRLAHLARQAVVVGVVVGDDHAVHLGDATCRRRRAPRRGRPRSSGSSQPVSMRTGPAVGVEDVDEGVAERVVGDGDLDGPYASAVVGHLRHRAPLSYADLELPPL